MKNFIEDFENLKITKKYLIGYADSEGAPHRGDGKSSLWNLAIIFKHIVDDNFIVVDECFHVTQFAMPKHSRKGDVTVPLQTHFDTINYLKNLHNCDRICLCFWNAPHDSAVLDTYQQSVLDIDTVDLLLCAKEHSKNMFKSYSIEKLCKQFNISTRESVHTALGDTIRMIHILPHVGISEPSKMLPYKKSKKQYHIPKHEKNNTYYGRADLSATGQQKNDVKSPSKFRLLVSKSIDKARNKHSNK